MNYTFLTIEENDKIILKYYEMKVELARFGMAESSLVYAAKSLFFQAT